MENIAVISELKMYVMNNFVWKTQARILIFDNYQNNTPNLPVEVSVFT